MRNRISTFLWVLVLTSFGTMSLFAQSTIHQGSPSSFMFIPGVNIGTDNWVQAKYNTNGYQVPNIVGVEGFAPTTFDGSGNHSHAFVKRNPNGSNQTECTTCFPSPTYNQFRPILAPKWDGSPGYVDTVIQLGCRQSYGKHSHSMTYTFVPDTLNPVLLLQYMFVSENKLSGGHDFSGNQFVSIKVTDTSGQLLDLGYYPHDYYTDFVQTSTGGNTAFEYTANVNGNFGPHGPWTLDYNNNPNFQPNLAWPYARYFFINPGSGGSSPRRLEMTPCWAEMNDSASVMQLEFCPRGNAGCTGEISSDCPTVAHYRWNVLAFNLTEQARQGIPVKLSVEQYGCTYTAHWSELYYTAKMVPGDIKADVCNSDTIIAMEVPWGFKTYRWFHGLDEESVRYPQTDANGNILEGQTLVLNRNSETIWPYYCCLMESCTGVPFVYKAYVRFYDLHPHAFVEQTGYEDGSATFHFTDSSYANVLSPSVDSVTHNLIGYDTTFLSDNQIRRTWFYKNSSGEVYPFPQHTHDVDFTLTLSESEYQNYAYVGVYIENSDGSCNSGEIDWMPIEVEHIGIDDRTADAGVTLHPNPTTGMVTLETPGDNISEVLLFDLKGALLHRYPAEGTQLQLDLSGRPAGTYLLKVMTVRGEQTMKVVKQ